MHRDVLGRKFCGSVYAVFKIVQRLAGKPRDQVHIYIETVFFRQGVLIENIFCGMLSADFYERFIVERLRIHAYSRNAVCFEQSERFVVNAIGSARLDGILRTGLADGFQNFFKTVGRERNGRAAADIKRTVFCKKRFRRLDFAAERVDVLRNLFFFAYFVGNEGAIRAARRTKGYADKKIRVAVFL